MAFQRTRLAADRTLMSVIRTAISLIGFGFTIAQFFNQLRTSQFVEPGRNPARNFGTAFIVLGIAMLTMGIVYHVAFMRELRHRRNEMVGGGLIHGQSAFPPSMVLITALLLLLIGVAAFASIAFRVGPFG
jgi:putative membrane protein